MNATIKATTLVRGQGKPSSIDLDAATEILLSTVSISFWGGIDPLTSIVIDRTHPLYGTSIADKVLAIPSGRGSCTGSQVLLELILNGIAPKAIVLRDVDPILCVGAIVAEEVFGKELEWGVPTILCVGREGFDELEGKSHAAVVSRDGSFDFIVGTSADAVKHEMEQVAEAIQYDTPNNKELSLNGGSVRNELELTVEEKAILEGKSGSAAERVALRTVCRVASITNAPRLLPVTQAHIDGCTYIGPGGLRFVQKLVELGGRVAVPTTLNSVSADRRRWAALGVSSDLATPANKVGDSYLELGCTHSFTCAPYLLPTRPGFGENIVWGESNAVVYANSICGARTDKYADYLDICAALVGRVPEMGVHLDANRAPGVLIDVNDLVKDQILPLILNGGDDLDEEHDIDAFFPTLGWLVGNLSDGRIPLILGMEHLGSTISDDDLKAFCAAFGTTGTAPLLHMAGVTPEAMDKAVLDVMIERCEDRAKIVTYDDVLKAFHMLDSGYSGFGRTEAELDHHGVRDRIDLIAFGNPHLSLTECERLARMVDSSTGSSSDGAKRGKVKPLTKHPDVKVMATLSRHIHEKAESQGYLQTLEAFGVQFVNDTCWCMLLDPPVVPSDPNGTIMTNSGKYAHYGQGLTSRAMRFGSMAQCITAATQGRWGPSPLTLPTWLKTNASRGSQQHRSYAARMHRRTLFTASRSGLQSRSRAQNKYNPGHGFLAFVRAYGRYAAVPITRGRYKIAIV